MIASKALPMAGSSPLARGLRPMFIFNLAFHRIIPARAGFTHGISPNAHDGSDHPRSRGVYTITISRRSRMRGSSPLARGLRTRTPESDAIAGIIPARAGFTDFAA